MSLPLNGFNKVAGIYDALARIVFGKALRVSQRLFLTDIPPDGNVLMLGGGTGGQLRALLEINHSCRVWYIEASSAMLDRAEKQLDRTQRERVHFVHGTEAFIPVNVVYDAVITGFFLDLFTDQALAGVIAKCSSALKREGLWLVTDFVDNGKWWQKKLLSLMYAFFRITCGIEAQRLPLWQKAMEHHGYSEIKSKLNYSAFIKSSLLQKGLINV
jgi:tRNA (cmo5U34)-methyltransferase